MLHGFFCSSLAAAVFFLPETQPSRRRNIDALWRLRFKISLLYGPWRCGIHDFTPPLVLRLWCFYQLRQRHRGLYASGWDQNNGLMTRPHDICLSGISKDGGDSVNLLSSSKKFFCYSITWGSLATTCSKLLSFLENVYYQWFLMGPPIDIIIYH